MRIYRYQVTAGQTLDVQVDVQSGDADLYVWSSDSSQSGRVSNQEGSADERVQIATVVPGLYQIEVYGFTAATYSINVTIGESTGAAPARWRGGISQIKTAPTTPRVGVTSSPSPNAGVVPNAPAQLNRVFIPLVSK